MTTQETIFLYVFAWINKLPKNDRVICFREKFNGVGAGGGG
jgi:hypothetical protein